MRITRRNARPARTQLKDPHASAARPGSPHPTSTTSTHLHLHRDSIWARPCHSCTGTRLAAAHICTGTRLTLPHLRRDWGSPRPHLHWDWANSDLIRPRAGLAWVHATPLWICVDAEGDGRRLVRGSDPREHDRNAGERRPLTRAQQRDEQEDRTREGLAPAAAAVHWGRPPLLQVPREYPYAGTPSTPRVPYASTPSTPRVPYVSTPSTPREPYVLARGLGDFARRPLARQIKRSALDLVAA